MGSVLGGGGSPCEAGDGKRADDDAYVQAEFPPHVPADVKDSSRNVTVADVDVVVIFDGVAVGDDDDDSVDDEAVDDDRGCPGVGLGDEQV